MGRLVNGTPLDWSEIKKLGPFVRQQAVLQFLRVYQQEKERKNEPFKWGDEIEFSIATLDEREQKARLCLLGPTILPILQQPELTDPIDHETKWRPEHARYMIEGTPGAEPYGDSLSDIDNVESNMKLRQKQLYEIFTELSSDAFPLTLSAFPRLGCPKFTSPGYDPHPESSVLKSQFYPDEVLLQPEEHPRFLLLSGNTLTRRERRMAINIPIFHDRCTPNLFKDVTPLAKPDHILLDTDGFASGCCSLQVTFQASSVEDGCYLYDQLAVLGPLLLALTAGSPIFRGYLSNIDCRWKTLVEACDDRTPGELGLRPLREGERVIPKSRWDSIEGYLATNSYNDQKVPYNEEAYEKLTKGGLPPTLAQHVAYLFIRDPLMILEEDLQGDPTNGTQHCDNLLTTNWQIVRLKLPVPEQNIGWRVEFRTMELQLTTSENAAFAVFVMLLARTILSLRPNLYIPISKLDENMQRAQRRDAVNGERFYFPRTTFPTNQAFTPTPTDSEITEMDLNTVFNGNGKSAGLISLINKYLDNTEVDPAARVKINKVLKFISQKASGELMTTATWMRKFVASHPDYKQDSVVSDKVTYDLISKIKLLSEGTETCAELQGPLI